MQQHDIVPISRANIELEGGGEGKKSLKKHTLLCYVIVEKYHLIRYILINLTWNHSTIWSGRK